MKAIMYHYVRVPDPALPYFRFLNIDNFRRQLDHFAERHGFVTRAEWEAFITQGRWPEPAGKVVLTFDDAMSCHYTHVFPELMARGLWGIFYVPTGPYAGGGLLDVHQIHLLCGARDGQALWDHARGLVTEEMIPHARRAAFREATYTGQTNNPGVSEVKRLLNYFIDEAHRSALIDRIAADFGMEFDPAHFYVAPAALCEMARAGMLIGAHSVSHPVMSKLAPEEQAREVRESLDWIARAIGPQPVTSYCHPYGGDHSFDGHTLRLLRENGVEVAFSVEPRDIAPGDRESRALALPRHDCNLFPHGHAD